MYPDWYTQETLDWYRNDAGNPSREEVIQSLRDYFNGYVEWLKNFAGLYDAYAELDLDMLIGEEIWDWREKLKNEVPKEGEVIITPHHIMDWDRLLSGEYTYFGMEAGLKVERYVDFFTKNITKLAEHKIKVHGWAMTNYEAIVKWPFYSVDSTSWISGSRFGVTYVYAGSGKINTHGPDQKHRRVQFKSDCDEFGVNYDDFMADKANEVDRFNGGQWVRYSRDMENYHVNAYWLDANERNELIDKAQSEWRTAVSVRRHDYSVAPKAKDLATLDYARFCNTCFLNQKCPVYARDSTCQIAGRPNLTDASSIKDVLMMLLELQTERVTFGAFAERVGGTPIDQALSKELANTFSLVKTAREIFDTRDEVTVKAKGTGIIAKLFGGYGKAGQGNPSTKSDNSGSVIDIEPND